MLLSEKTGVSTCRENSIAASDEDGVVRLAEKQVVNHIYQLCWLLFLIKMPVYC